MGSNEASRRYRERDERGGDMSEITCPICSGSGSFSYMSIGTDDVLDYMDCSHCSGTGFIDDSDLLNLDHDTLVVYAERTQTDLAKLQAALESIRAILDGADTGELSALEAIAEIVWAAQNGESK
jgi:hypothetical protein